MIKESYIVTRERGDLTIPQEFRDLMGIKGKAPLKLVLDENNILHIEVIKL